ncbi:uncharacterized protein YfdQ (DUF2303 family) [Variovorax sp. GrIS 2.14]|uniref:DUF2303 family protein n=1 Tax=Variovorax sp. GrIS 2.14 TaxID=3071709 RepID=UPI0038F6B783
MENIIEAAQYVAAAAVAALEPKVILHKVGAVTNVVLPPEHSLVDITKALETAQATPNRKQGMRSLADVPSFIKYLDDQAAQSTAYVYSDLEQRTLTCIFNDNKASAPGWRDQGATFRAELTDEFKLWINQDRKQFTQLEFATFIEDNFADLAGADATTLLTVATTIQAVGAINFSSVKRLHDGTSQLTFNELIEAGAGPNGDMKIPKTFLIGVRIFKSDGATDGASILARLKYKLHSGSVKFTFELDRHELVIKRAFQAYTDAVANAVIEMPGKPVAGAQPTKPLGYTVLNGKA